MKHRPKMLQEMLVVCMGMSAMCASAGEPPPKMVPRPIPGMSGTREPVPPRPAQPPPSAPATPMEQPDVSDHIHARILSIRRKPAKPAAATVSDEAAKAKDIKAPRAHVQAPQELKPGQIRIIPKAEAARILAPEAAKPEAKETTEAKPGESKP